ncbi:MAG: FkbM family methyltransferase [Candidatus Babeliales bacterium]
MVKCILKLLRLVIDIVGFMVVVGGIIFLVAKATHRPKNLSAFINCSGAFLKKSLEKDSFEYQGEPGKIEKFLVHVKLLFREAGGSTEGDSGVSDRIFGMHLLFPDYAMLHSLVDEIFIHKIYAFTSKRPDPFIIDAGSNIGMSILFFKKMYPQAIIMGFEPSKRNFYMLEKNIKDNGLFGVRVFNKALTNDSATKEITLYNAGTTCGTLCKTGPTSRYEVVQTALLSSYINQPVDLLKMDIEGAEYDVFQDLFDNDKLQFVDQIIMEYHNPQGKISKLFDMFDKSGFTYEIKKEIIFAYKPLR